MHIRSVVGFALMLVACGDNTAPNTAPDGGAPGPDGGTTHDGGPPGPDGGGTDPGGGSTQETGTVVGDFLGVNGFIDDPTDKLAAIGNVREYHSWSWCEGNGDAMYPGYPNNQNSFSLWNGFWDFDTYYADLQAKGVVAYPVMQGGVPWLNNSSVPPVPAGADASDPASYAAHADHLFQYAARYGQTKVSEELLKLAADQKPLSGLGTLRYIEDFNEQDATWILPNGQHLFTPEQYAAMASADYDGDQGKMGKTVGVKNADPNIKLVMGGLAGSGTGVVEWEKSIETYIDGVRTWASAHRGGSFPADVINLHYYSFGPDPFGTENPRPAVSPEEDKVEETMALLRVYRDKYLPGKELWITEFGYDTDAQSRLRAPALGKNSAAVVQGQWLVRYYFALLAAGFDRAFLYMLRDACEGNDCHVQFGTSGLTTVKDKWEPKPSFFFLATVRSRLGSFRWSGAVDSGSPDVRIAKLKDASSKKTAYVLWAPTSEDKTVAGYQLDVGAAGSATGVTLADKQMNGVESALTATGGKVTLDVNETPQIVLVDGL